LCAVVWVEVAVVLLSADVVVVEMWCAGDAAEAGAMLDMDVEGEVEAA